VPRRRRYTDDELRLAVERADGIADAPRLLGRVPPGGNYETFRRRVRELQLDTSHFSGRVGARVLEDRWSRLGASPRSSKSTRRIQRTG
jgi:hypothetical protein